MTRRMFRNFYRDGNFYIIWEAHERTVPVYSKEPSPFILKTGGYKNPPVQFYSSVCFPRNEAATCVSLISVRVGAVPLSLKRSATAPEMSPLPIMG